MDTKRPRLIVFDLDFTLWDCDGTWCDCLSPPFQRDDQRVADASGRQVHLYQDVNAILDWCDESQIEMALASRTEQPGWARSLLALLNVDHRFGHQEIYPTSKVKHFAVLRELAGIDFQDMLFFDDELRNIHEVGDLGVTCIHVLRGMSETLFKQGLEQHDALRRGTS